MGASAYKCCFECFQQFFIFVLDGLHRSRGKWEGLVFYRQKSTHGFVSELRALWRCIESHSMIDELSMIKDPTGFGEAYQAHYVCRRRRRCVSPRRSSGSRRTERGKIRTPRLAHTAKFHVLVQAELVRSRGAHESVGGAGSGRVGGVADGSAARCECAVHDGPDPSQRCRGGIGSDPEKCRVDEIRSPR